jgi:hypothetical protein
MPVKEEEENAVQYDLQMPHYAAFSFLWFTLPPYSQTFFTYTVLFIH